MRFRGFLIRRYETFSPLDKADSCECYFTEIIFTESKFSKEVIPFNHFMFLLAEILMLLDSLT